MFIEACLADALGPESGEMPALIGRPREQVRSVFDMPQSGREELALASTRHRPRDLSRGRAPKPLRFPGALSAISRAPRWTGWPFSSLSQPEWLMKRSFGTSNSPPPVSAQSVASPRSGDRRKQRPRQGRRESPSGRTSAGREWGPTLWPVPSRRCSSEMLCHSALFSRPDSVERYTAREGDRFWATTITRSGRIPSRRSPRGLRRRGRGRGRERPPRPFPRDRSPRSVTRS